MKVLFFTIVLCCVLLPITFSTTLDRPYTPSNSTFVKYDLLPRWFKEKMRTSKYLNIRKLPFKYVIDVMLRVKVDKCDWKDEDKQFYLNPNNTIEQKLSKMYSMPYCEIEGELHDLLKAQAGNVSEAIKILVKIYSESAYMKLNSDLRGEKIDDELPYALALYDSLKYRLVPYNNGTIYRGTFCQLNKLKERLGQVIEVDQFTSFSRNPRIANNFKTKKRDNLDVCFITMTLEGDDWCGVDIEPLSSVIGEEEVLVPFSTRVKLLDIVPINDTITNTTTHYNMTWKCAEKLFSEEANSVEQPKAKASSLFYD